MLPVIEIYPDLVASLKANSMTLLQAPPGAGKSTWLPLQLIRDGHFQRIVMLEPRRLAARNIAGYLAKCQNETLGESIGLRIRQEKHVSVKTKLEIVTEGMLTRMLQSDPELNGVDCLIFDEFHERSIAADTALAFAIETQQALRDDLTLLLMSATLDTDRIVSKFGCPVITSDGRSFPIDEFYHPVKNEKRWLDEIPILIKQALREQSGSCLVFLPGKREINYVARALSDVQSSSVVVCPLYGDQTKSAQQSAIAPAKRGQRKIVLATNVAETSLTIEGIRIVVDSGKRRAAQFNLNTGVTELKTVTISKSSSVQRAGRAGRIEPGVVYRLGSKEVFNRKESHDLPEILCSDISALLLESRLWGTEISDLTLLDSPSLAQREQGYELLQMLEAVDQQKRITRLGKKLLTLGTDVRWARMLLKAQELDSSIPGLELLSIYLVALLDSRVSQQAELRTELQAQWNSPHPVFTKQLRYWLKRFNHRPNASLKISALPLLVSIAYPDRIAKRRGEGYVLANGAGVDSRSGCWLNDEFIAIAELGGAKGKRIFSATSVDMSELEAVLPHLFQQRSVCEFDERNGRFVYEDRSMLGALVVRQKPINAPIDVDVRTTAWTSFIKKRGFAVFSMVTNNASVKSKNAFSQLLIRMTLAHRHYPNDYPEISEQSLLARVDSWLAPYLSAVNNLEQLKRIDLIEPLKNCFDWNLQESLNTLLPSSLKVPSGSTVAVSYQLDGPATLSVRMQEVFGMSATPELCNGKIDLLMDLLSPARRSLQLTQDLNRFWSGSYKEIQKEMKGRYPKHYWPDNPAQAKATSKTKARM
ncbi:ATP-dependent helicase HrpB [Arenicella sp. 4NH20-0111]|uniref:ATP-dependent helicase HrpB n=1 Tax=Arenicella sp. 4NH20-0111 TaxID=3127648 RepID=UPI0033416CB1